VLVHRMVVPAYSEALLAANSHSESRHAPTPISTLTLTSTSPGDPGADLEQAPCPASVPIPNPIYDRLRGILQRVMAGKRVDAPIAHAAHNASHQKHPAEEAEAIRVSRQGTSGIDADDDSDGGALTRALDPIPSAPLFLVHPVIEGRIVVTGGMDLWEAEEAKRA